MTDDDSCWTPDALQCGYSLVIEVLGGLLHGYPNRANLFCLPFVHRTNGHIQHNQSKNDTARDPVGCAKGDRHCCKSWQSAPMHSASEIWDRTGYEDLEIAIV